MRAGDGKWRTASADLRADSCKACVAGCSSCGAMPTARVPHTTVAQRTTRPCRLTRALQWPLRSCGAVAARSAVRRCLLPGSPGLRRVQRRVGEAEGCAGEAERQRVVVAREAALRLARRPITTRQALRLMRDTTQPTTPLRRGSWQRSGTLRCRVERPRVHHRLLGAGRALRSPLTIVDTV